MNDQTVRADDSKRADAAQRAAPVQVFAIFDVEHDQDLYELLHAQSIGPGCGFVVAAGSDGSADTEVWRDRVRRRIRDADQVIVICGEHADASSRIHTELVIAQEEEKPYVLLWGRRGVMCTKPLGAKSAEGIYSWTLQFLDDQINQNLRKAGTDAKAKSLRRVTHDPPPPPRTAASTK